MTILGIEFSHWDFVLIAVVSVQSIFLAYLHRPKWKAFLLCLPVPFTVATLSVARPIDTTNLTGFFLLFLFMHGVRILYWHLKCPIVLAIAICALSFCALGTALAKVLPQSDAAFWLISALVLVVALFFHRALPHRTEPGHRSSLPVWVKLLIIVAVIVGLVIIKRHLQGFMTMFPMVSIMACYEARHSLWTMCRQVPIMMMLMLPTLIVMRLTEPVLGYAGSLVPGWLIFLALLIPMMRHQWKTHFAEEVE
ncbi:MAG: hypothetical protein HY343_06170 [Lentisphaerae bacterium]|nr:hypothetical protein [Lentisphaerota bacterium]